MGVKKKYCCDPAQQGTYKVYRETTKGIIIDDIKIMTIVEEIRPTQKYL